MTEREVTFVDACAKCGQPGFHEGTCYNKWRITLNGVEVLKPDSSLDARVKAAHAGEGWVDFWGAYPSDGECGVVRWSGTVTITWEGGDDF